MKYIFSLVLLLIDWLSFNCSLCLLFGCLDATKVMSMCSYPYNWQLIQPLCCQCMCSWENNSIQFRNSISVSNVSMCCRCCFCKVRGDGVDGQGKLLPIPVKLRRSNSSKRSKSHSKSSERKSTGEDDELYAHEYCLWSCPSIYFDHSKGTMTGRV